MYCVLCFVLCSAVLCCAVVCYVVLQQCEALFPPQGGKPLPSSRARKRSSSSRIRGNVRQGGRRGSEHSQSQSPLDFHFHRQQSHSGDTNIDTDTDTDTPASLPTPSNSSSLLLSSSAQSPPPPPPRLLRMHMNQDGSRAKDWKFSPSGAWRSCAPRVRNFGKVLQLAQNKQSVLATRLLQLDTEVRRFGYSLSPLQAYPYTRIATAFDEWDLMSSAQGRRHPPQ